MSPVDLLGMAVQVPHGPPDSNVNTTGSLDRGGPDRGPGQGAGRPALRPGRPGRGDDRPADGGAGPCTAGRHPGVLAIQGFTSPTPRVGGTLTARVSAIVRFDDGLVPDSAGSRRAACTVQPGLRRPVRDASRLVAGDQRLCRGAAAAGSQPGGVHRRGPVAGPPVLAAPKARCPSAAWLTRRRRAARHAPRGGGADHLRRAGRAHRAGHPGPVAQPSGQHRGGRVPVLRALGASRGALAAASLAGVAVVTLAGGLLGTGIAIAASPLMPHRPGPSGRAQPRH